MMINQDEKGLIMADTLNSVIKDWKAKKRRMGCLAATKWLCKRIPGWKPIRLQHYNEDGELYEHVVATNGSVHIDLAPYANRPN